HVDVPDPVHSDPRRVVRLPVPVVLAAAKNQEERAGIRELLQAAGAVPGESVVELARLGDEDVPASVHGKAGGDIELTVAATEAAPLGQEGPVAVEFLNAIVHAVRNEDVPAPIDGDVHRFIELSVPVALAAE